MTKTEKIKAIFSQRLRGFETPPDGEQLIIDVINMLSDKGITVERADSVLKDASTIIKAMTEI